MGETVNHVQDALVEWVAALAVGLVPLVAHSIVAIFAQKEVTPPILWTIDVLFAVITTSGGSLVSVLARLVLRRQPHHHFGRGCVLLCLLALLFFLCAAVVYGLTAGGVAKNGTIWAAVVLLFGSAVASAFTEISIAAGLSALKRSPVLNTLADTV